MPDQNPYRNQGRANASVLRGWRFFATLQLRTPLCALIHHGEVVEGVDTELPSYGPSWAGIWTPELKSWDEILGLKPGTLNLSKIPKGTMASEIGQVPTDGGDLLPFLIAYRTILESEGSVDERLRRVKALLDAPEHQELVTKLGAYSVEWTAREWLSEP